MKNPNLIYVFADQLRWASLGCNGDGLAHTPNIDALFEDCAVMENCVSGHPVCAPYRASLLTGKYTTSTGMVINEIRINPEHRSFAHVLNDAGYESCYIGKWHLYAARLGDHYNPENSYIPAGPDRLGFNGFFAAYNFHHEYFAPKAYYHLNSPEKIFCDRYEPDCQTDMAIGKIKELSRSEKPFALFLSLGTPHDPWDAKNVPEKYLKLFDGVEFKNPPNYLEHNDPHADMWARLRPRERKELGEWRRVYYAMTANLDENVGRIVQAIDEAGIADDTIFVFTSDHGELFGAHGRRAKNIFYDEAVRVPFLLRRRGVPAGRNYTCMNTVDIMPTLLKMMGLDCPAESEGEELSSFIESGENAHNDSLMMGTGPTAIYGAGREWRALRTERFTYAVYRADKKELLFDNLKDPYQMHDLFDDAEYADIKNSLKSRMYEKMAAIGDDFESNGFYRRHWVKKRRIKQRLPRRCELK